METKSTPIDRTAEYQQAVDELRTGQFQQAEQRLVHLLEWGGHPQVYHALGNAYYRQDKLNLAYGAYVQGLALSPRDKELQTNISVVEEKLDAIPVDGGLLTVQEWSIVIGFWASVLFVSALWKKNIYRTSISLGAAVCLLLSFGFWGMEWSRSGQGIIIQHTYARSMIEKGVELYSLRVGQQVTMLEKANGYWLVEHPEHGMGWISIEALVAWNPYQNQK